MAPPDGMEDTGGQDEGHQMPIRSKRRSSEPMTEDTKPNTSTNFMDLPYKIRKQILHEALLVDEDRGKPFLTSGLASVSKEWRDDIEEVLFNDIIINTLDGQEVSTFKEMFSTDKRRRLLTCLNIAIDDNETGPWYQERGIVQISRIMTSIGKFLQYINGWDFGTAGGGRRALEIVFATLRFPDARQDWSNDQRFVMNTSSLWEAPRLNTATANKFSLTFLPLDAVNYKFPCSLDMVTCLCIPPDCVPISAAERIIQTMPNLEILVLDPKFDVHYEEAWEHFTDLIELLRSSAPSLRNLIVRDRSHDPCWSERPRPTYPGECMEQFSAALREYSQGLECLEVIPFELDQEFMRPFSPIKKHVYSNTWTWPHLRHIVLQFFDQYTPEHEADPEDQTTCSNHSEEGATQQAQGSTSKQSSGIQQVSRSQYEVPPQPRDEWALTASDLLVAAGRATLAMPILETAHVSVWRGEEGAAGIFVERELCPKFGSTASSRVWLTDHFDSEDREEIMDAWAHFLGPDPEFDEDLPSEF